MYVCIYYQRTQQLDDKGHITHKYNSDKNHELPCKSRQ
jgi:hypothetical protein